MATKRCSKCKLEKPTSEFNRSRSMPDGLQNQCRDCHNPQARKNTWARQGIEIDEAGYKAAFAKQEGRCAICTNPAPKGRRLAVDHDHATGAVRSLLCTGCNTLLGRIERDPTVMERLTEYVERHAAGKGPTTGESGARD